MCVHPKLPGGVRNRSNSEGLTFALSKKTDCLLEVVSGIQELFSTLSKITQRNTVARLQILTEISTTLGMLYACNGNTTFPEPLSKLTFQFSKALNLTTTDNCLQCPHELKRIVSITCLVLSALISASNLALSSKWFHRFIREQVGQRIQAVSRWLSSPSTPTYRMNTTINSLSSHVYHPHHRTEHKSVNWCLQLVNIFVVLVTVLVLLRDNVVCAIRSQLVRFL